MNKHRELVKKWLADPASVTQQELQDNWDAANAATYADARTKVKNWIIRYEELKEQDNE